MTVRRVLVGCMPLCLIVVVVLLMSGCGGGASPPNLGLPGGPATQTCPDGSTIPAGEQCPTPTQTCPDGSTIPAGEQCPTPTQTCPGGSTVSVDEYCPPPPTPPATSEDLNRIISSFSLRRSVHDTKGGDGAHGAFFGEPLRDHGLYRKAHSFEERVHGGTRLADVGVTDTRKFLAGPDVGPFDASRLAFSSGIQTFVATRSVSYNPSDINPEYRKWAVVTNQSSPNYGQLEYPNAEQMYDHRFVGGWGSEAAFWVMASTCHSSVYLRCRPDETSATGDKTFFSAGVWSRGLVSRHPALGTSEFQQSVRPLDADPAVIWRGPAVAADYQRTGEIEAGEVYMDIDNLDSPDLDIIVDGLTHPIRHWTNLPLERDPYTSFVYNRLLTGGGDKIINFNDQLSGIFSDRTHDEHLYPGHEVYGVFTRDGYLGAFGGTRPKYGSVEAKPSYTSEEIWMAVDALIDSSNTVIKTSSSDVSTTPWDVAIEPSPETLEFSQLNQQPENTPLEYEQLGSRNNVHLAIGTHASVSGEVQLSYLSLGGWMSHSFFLLNGLAREDTTRTNGMITLEPHGYSIGSVAGSSPVAGGGTWSGAMTGIDLSVETGDAASTRVHGDATVLMNDFAQPVIDVSFTGIWNPTSGTRHDDMVWTNVPLADGVFTEDGLHGQFYGPSHEEVGGLFYRNQTVGAFGAKREE